MVKILDFEAARKATSGKSTAEKAHRCSPVSTLATNQDVFQDVFDRLISAWQAAAAKNSLNTFIKSKIPAHVHGAESADYVNDLNAIANVEQKLGMKVTMLYPEVTPGNPHGWLVGFHRGTDVYSAPPVMVSESYARALNVLLFLGFEFQLKKLKRS